MEEGGVRMSHACHKTKQQQPPSRNNKEFDPSNPKLKENIPTYYCFYPQI